MLRFSTAIAALLAASGAVVCSAQPPIPDHAAQILVQYGRVSALTENGERPLFVGDAVKPQQMIVTGPDGYAQFRLSDGSTFEVFANSKMMFREHVGNFTDLLNMVIGHVKVYIQHLNGLPNYNKVYSPTAVISVRGTVFEVVVEDDDGTTFVSVDEGLVGVRNQTAPGDSVNLASGDSIRVFRDLPLQAKSIDKGSIFRAVLRAAEEAVYQIAMRPNGSAGPLPGGGTIPTGPTGNGDKGKGGDTSAPPPPSAPGAPN